MPPPRGIKRGDVPTSTKSEENPTDTQLPDILKPPQGRQTTVDGNAAVAAVETAFDQRIVDSERRSSASAVASEVCTCLDSSFQQAAHLLVAARL